MKMYIANCTQQIQEFNYRLPETLNMRNQRIDIGRQILISGDLNQAEIDSIVEQHARYGLTAVGDVDRTKPFIGLAYSIDKVVPIEKIKRAIVHNHEVLTERGHEERTNAAVAVNQALEEQNPGANLRTLDMSVEEQASSKNPDPTFNEGVRVSKDAPPDGGKSGKRK